MNAMAVETSAVVAVHGPHVLVVFVGFFAIVFAVNGYF